VSKHFLLVFSGLVAALLLAIGCGHSASAGAPAAPAAPAPSSALSILRLASTPWAPFTGKEGQPRVALDLVARALERTGHPSRTTIVPDGTLVPGLQDGHFDGSAALWDSEDRRKFLLYSAPYLENRLMLVGRKGSSVSARSFAELAGKRIAIVEGYAYGQEVDSAHEPTFVRVKSSQETVRAVLSGQVDYCLLDALVTEFLIEQHQARDSLEVGTVPLVKRTLHLALRKDVPDAAAIIARFDEVMRDMVGDGSYNLALQVNWIEADVDGDGRTELVRNGDHIGTAPPTASYALFQGTGEGAPHIGVPQHPRYYVNGRAYESWDRIPDTLKLQPAANEVGGGHPQVQLFEW
jgi:polar amino acid transport system substrate-binding protein